jgi:hypothetical protein
MCATGRVETVEFWGDGSVARLPYGYSDLYPRNRLRRPMGVSSSSSSAAQIAQKGNQVRRATAATAKLTQQKAAAGAMAESPPQQRSDVKPLRENPRPRNAREGTLEY